MTGPLVTVVTPVYNGESHLAECIESILAQTYGNWEYVLVDNCSTDRTPEIVGEFARADDRIRHERHDEFVDIVASYVRAFRAVSPAATYCKVVGADDWLFPDCLARMVELGERHPTVGVVGGYRLNGERVDLVNLPYWQSTVPGREMVGRELRSPFALTGSPTALLFRSELVRERDPFWDDTFYHADSEAACWALMRSDYGHVHQVLTYNREASASTRHADRIDSYLPDRLRMLLRYGPHALPEKAYREELRAQLRTYVGYHLRAFAWRHTKRHLKRVDTGHEAFRSFQRQALDHIEAAADGDPEVLRAVRLARALLR